MGGAGRRHPSLAPTSAHSEPPEATERGKKKQQKKNRPDQLSLAPALLSSGLPTHPPLPVSRGPGDFVSTGPRAVIRNGGDRD